MLKPTELRELWRDLADREVLSVYLDTRVTDPAMRDAWRPALQTAVRAAGAHITGAAERQRFERASAHLREPSSPPGGVWGAPGWVAFATEDGLRYAGNLPVQPSPIAAWRVGPLVAPYMRALKQRHPVVVALVESRTIRLYRYAEGALKHLEELKAPAEDASNNGSTPTMAPRGSALPAARGAVGTEVAARRRHTTFNRLAAQFADRVGALAGDEGWLLIGGTTEWAHLAQEALPKRFDGRALVSTTLNHDASDPQIIREAKNAATELRGARGRELVGELLDRAGSHSRAAVGVPAVQRALRASAVDLLLVSPEFIRDHEEIAEAAVRLAVEQGATVEVPSGEGASKLDQAATGIAARLRFSIDGAPAEEDTELATTQEARA